MHQLPSTILCVLWLAILLTASSAIRVPRFSPIRSNLNRLIQSTSVHSQNEQNETYPYKTAYFDGMPIDHMNALHEGNFSLKYLHNIQHYKPGGPVLFYTGNEGKIESFAKNAGVLRELAPVLNAAVFFVEHRYYSLESSPFGKNCNKNIENLKYLSSRQALADFAFIIPHLRDFYNISDSSKWIAVGGSYGGMLAAWFRLKYPHIIHGAWASSAPVVYFRNAEGIQYSGFDHATKDVLASSGCNFDIINKAFDIIEETDLDTLNRVFSIAERSKLTKPEHISDLLDYIGEAFSYAVMTDYPYETSFLVPLPAWPAEKMCEFLSGEVPDSNLTIITQLANSINVFYNHTGDHQESCVRRDVCPDEALSGLDVGAMWAFQYCTELTISMCDGFPPGNSNETICRDNFYDDTAQGCVEQMRYTNAAQETISQDEVGFDAVEEYYGLKFDTLSNVIFTNGALDPWSAGGVTAQHLGGNYKQRDIFNFHISGGAHHLELRQSNTCDPPAVVDVRKKIVDILRCWTLADIDSCQSISAEDFETLSTDPKSSQTNCVYREEDYLGSSATNVRKLNVFAVNILMLFLLWINLTVL